ALFRVRLPVARAHEPAETGAARSASGFPRHRILVVDDESEVADVLREILELAGHDVDFADSGEAALRRLASTDYDVVLSDMRMPGMSGAAPYGAVRERSPRLAARFGFITGDAVSPANAAFLKRTGIPYLTKPFEPRQVTELVARLAGACA